MPKFVRILVVALLAVFAAGSVLHATSTTSMAVEMALADSGPMEMSDCLDANGNGSEGGLACDLACPAPSVADLGSGSHLSVPVAALTALPEGAFDIIGRTGAPEPYPPRTLI